jgi:hypothetical protein
VEPHDSICRWKVAAIYTPAEQDVERILLSVLRDDTVKVESLHPLEEDALR